MMMIDDDDD